MWVKFPMGWGGGGGGGGLEERLGKGDLGWNRHQLEKTPKIVMMCEQ